MPELGRGDVAVAVLVEVAQALDEVFGRVGRAVLADGLQDGQEDLEVDALLCESRSKSVKTRLGPQTESPPPPPPPPWRSDSPGRWSWVSFFTSDSVGF